MNKEKTMRITNGNPICPNCGAYIQILPEFFTIDLYAYRCACCPPLGWRYTPNLIKFNPVNS